MMKSAVLLLAILATSSASPQYGGGQVGDVTLTPEQIEALGSLLEHDMGSSDSLGALGSNSGTLGAQTGISTTNPLCEVGYGCVNVKICVNGKIDTTGAGLLNERTKLTSCDGNNVCCLEPIDEDYPEPHVPNPIPHPGPTLPETCLDKNEDCVIQQLCINGEIDTTGSALLNPRVRPVSTCYDPKNPSLPAVCCRKPGLCPEHQECVLNNQCGSDGYTILADNSGTDYLANGIECDTYDGDYGVCCTPTEIGPFFPTAGVCGFRNQDESTLDPHIQRGYAKDDAYFGEFPWQTIVFLSNFTFQCGGVLISDSHVLTAAHCVYGLQPYDLKLRLGEWQVNSFKEFLPYQDRDVSSIIIHGDYKQDGSQRNNIAVLELSTPVKFDYHINTVCLPSVEQKFSGYCVATGWGKDSFYGDYQHILKKVELPTVPRRECRDKLRQTELGEYFRLDRSFLCAGGEEGIDTCTGDGGGPLVCLDPISNKYYLAGIINAGLKCGKSGVPALYTNVAYMDSWITNIILGSGYQEPAPLPGQVY